MRRPVLAQHDRLGGRTAGRALRLLDGLLPDPVLHGRVYGQGALLPQLPGLPRKVPPIERPV